MNAALNKKVVMLTQPAAIVDNAAFTTASLDTKGFKKAIIYVALGALDIALSVFKLRESDDDSAYTDVTNGNFASGTKPDGVAAALPSATDDNKIYAINVDLRGKKRYLDLSLTGGDGTAGTYAVVWAELCEPEEGTNTMAKRGSAQELHC
jgi:hypothetical protein